MKGERNKIGTRAEWKWKKCRAIMKRMHGWKEKIAEWEWIRMSVEMWIDDCSDYYGRGKDWRRCYQAMRKRVRCAKVWE